MPQIRDGRGVLRAQGLRTQLGAAEAPGPPTGSWGRWLSRKHRQSLRCGWRGFGGFLGICWGPPWGCALWVPSCRLSVGSSHWSPGAHAGGVGPSSKTSGRHPRLQDAGLGPSNCPTGFSPEAQFSSVTQSCLTLCDPMACSMPGLPVHHRLPESTQTRVHRVGDAIQPSRSLSSPSPTFSLSQHQGLFQ